MSGEGADLDTRISLSSVEYEIGADRPCRFGSHSETAVCSRDRFAVALHWRNEKRRLGAMKSSAAGCIWRALRSGEVLLRASDKGAPAAAVLWTRGAGRAGSGGLWSTRFLTQAGHHARELPAYRELFAPPGRHRASSPGWHPGWRQSPDCLRRGRQRAALHCAHSMLRPPAR